MEVKEAADLLDNLIGMVEDSHGADYDTALRMGIEALTAQPDRILYANMSDAEFERWLYEHGICNPNIHESIPCDAVPLLIDNAISELPSSQPPIEERKTGKWNRRKGMYEIGFKCSECNSFSIAETPYCSFCGSHMVQEGEDNGKVD